MSLILLAFTAVGPKLYDGCENVIITEELLRRS